MAIINELKLSKDLIRFPSITPKDAGAIKFLSKKLKKLGFNCKILEFKDKKSKDIIKPYYTTKEKGTGLGLSIVDKIINDHNGSIKFLNTNNGAKVQIILPK